MSFTAANLNNKPA